MRKWVSMKIGVPKEIKKQEYRVALVPGSVGELINAGHEVFVETQAGEGVGYSDDHYRNVGAVIVNSPAEVFETAELIVKVKEPQPQEIALLRPQHTLFTFLHLASDKPQAEALMKSGATCIAYETVTDDSGRLPLLVPMSEVAGRMSIQAGARFLEKTFEGAGILLSGVPGVESGKVVILGGGVAGTNAAFIASSLGAQVFVIDKSLPRLRELESLFRRRIVTVHATKNSIDQHVVDADLVVGAVLVPGDAAPKLVTRNMVSRMRKGSVIVDIAIDQGGCCETSRPTTHGDPTFIVDGIVHYCVANIPGAVPRTSSRALNNATLPFVLELANKGPEDAIKGNPHLANGVNVYKSEIAHEVVGRALNLPVSKTLKGAA